MKNTCCETTTARPGNPAWFNRRASVEAGIRDFWAWWSTARDRVLGAIEDELDSELGGVAVYFGRETRPGHRVLHWYAPEDSPAQGIIDRWTQQHPERRPHVEWIRDPTWQFVKRYA